MDENQDTGFWMLDAGKKKRSYSAGTCSESPSSPNYIKQVGYLVNPASIIQYPASWQITGAA
jgi:hypothetical protein